MPAAEQLSVRTASQPTQLTPLLPQVAKEGVLQVAPEQQPFGQLVELQPLHVPLLQVWPEGQMSQLPPPVPQEDALSPARHVPAEQQPCGQDVPSQTQVLERHRWPGAHAAPAPHWQLPVDEQLSERWSHAAQVEPLAPHVVRDRVWQNAPWQHPLGHDVASHTHWPELQRWPPRQAGPAPQAQLPSLPQ